MSFDKPLDIPKPKLRLPIHDATQFVLVRPHYPENVGAVARAIKTMGFTPIDPDQARASGGPRNTKWPSKWR